MQELNYYYHVLQSGAKERQTPVCSTNIQLSKLTTGNFFIQKATE